MQGSLDGRLVSERLFEWLEYEGQTTSELAERQGMSRTTISNVLNGKIERPHLNTVRKIARNFGVTVEEFLAGVPEDPKARARTAAIADWLRDLPEAEHLRVAAGLYSEWTMHEASTAGGIIEARRKVEEAGFKPEEVLDFLLKNYAFTAEWLKRSAQEVPREAVGVHLDLQRLARQRGLITAEELGQRIERFEVA